LMRVGTNLLLLALGLAASGCRPTRPCRAGTAFVVIEYDAAAAAASAFDLSIELGSVTKVQSRPHTPGDTRDTVEIEFPAGYPRGQVLRVDVSATGGPGPVGHGHAEVILDDACE